VYIVYLSRFCFARYPLSVELGVDSARISSWSDQSRSWTNSFFPITAVRLLRHLAQTAQTPHELFKRKFRRHRATPTRDSFGKETADRRRQARYGGRMWCPIEITSRGGNENERVENPPLSICIRDAARRSRADRGSVIKIGSSSILVRPSLKVFETLDVFVL